MTDINNIFKFGTYELNAVQRALKNAGDIVDIEPRAFDLLIFLVQNRHRAVGKNELQDVIWPGMIVTETALTRAVMKARKAIGNDAARQHYLDGRDIFVETQDQLRVQQSDLKIARLDPNTDQWEKAGQMASQVLEASREQALMQPEVEALELLGDLEMARGNVSAAILEYTAVTSRLREASWASKENDLNIKLADAYMDISGLDAAAPLIGALAGGEESVASLKTRARFRFPRGEAGKAAELMTRAKELAGQTWSGENEAALTQYAASRNP